MTVRLFASQESDLKDKLKYNRCMLRPVNDSSSTCRILAVKQHAPTFCCSHLRVIRGERPDRTGDLLRMSKEDVEWVDTNAFLPGGASHVLPRCHVQRHRLFT